MARPIAETPTIYGDDARRFSDNMRKVDNMPREQRRANRAEFERRYQEVAQKHNLKIVL